MSYFDTTKILAADSPSIDAFGRWRVSEPVALFDSKQLYDTGSLVWSTKLVGNATCSYIANNACVDLFVTGSNTRAVRQTKKHFNYQPGKSHLIITTGRFGPYTNGVIKNMGYFDNSNGVFFQQSGSSFGVVLRSNVTGTPVDTFISQSNWNMDKFDGTGTSGRRLEITSSQIYFCDFEWLGVGRIRYGIFQGGGAYYVHQITNINALNSVYMSNPNLPVTYEIISSGSLSGSLRHICSSVMSEGGFQENGIIRCVDLGASSITIGASGYVACLAVRLKSDHLNSTIIPKSLAALSAAGNNNFQWSLLLNPVVGATFTWVPISDSSVEYATGSATATITSEGVKIASGYVSTAQDSIALSLDEALGIGADVDDNRDSLVLAIRNLGNSAAHYASFTWRESV